MDTSSKLPTVSQCCHASLSILTAVRTHEKNIYQRRKIVKSYKTSSVFDRHQTMYLLTEWEGRTGKYLARGHDVRTERSEVRAS